LVKIGLVGTGILGEAVGLHLLESGYSLTVYNRTVSKTESLKEKGATVADQPKHVAESSDLVITCVKDADAVNQVLFGQDGLVAGKQAGMTVADMSTINPSSAKEFSKKLHNEGIKSLEIPVAVTKCDHLAGYLDLVGFGFTPVGVPLVDAHALVWDHTRPGAPDVVAVTHKTAAARDESHLTLEVAILGRLAAPEFHLPLGLVGGRGAFEKLGALGIGPTEVLADLRRPNPGGTAVAIDADWVVSEVIRERDEADAHLPQITRTLGAGGLAFGLGQCRQQHGG